ncbi:MAG: maleylacetate reductase [Chloroflexota bacterium]
MTDLNFDYTALPVRVLFGVGRLSELADEVRKLGGRALVLTTPFQAELGRQIVTHVGDLCAGLHDQAVPHVPQTTIDNALRAVNECSADVLIAVGGGSTIGLAKGIALETQLPILAVPTTYAGSEMTHIWGISKDGRKTTGRNPMVKPRTVIYDPELVKTLPPKLSLTSGINAMAHAVEALYAQNANPIASMMAEESILRLAHSLPAVVSAPNDISARTESLYGAWLAATVLDSVGMALHHKLCHTLGGSYNMPHAETHTVMLPYVVAYNAPEIPAAMVAMSRALGCRLDDVPGAIQDISRQNGGPVSLKELGFHEADLDEAAAIATTKPYYNPRRVTRDEIYALFGKAFVGERP